MPGTVVRSRLTRRRWTRYWNLKANIIKNGPVSDRPEPTALFLPPICRSEAFGRSAAFYIKKFSKTPLRALCAVGFLRQYKKHQRLSKRFAMGMIRGRFFEDLRKKSDDVV